MEIRTSDDGRFVRIHANPTGIPMSEVSITDAPKLDPAQLKQPTSATPAPPAKDTGGDIRPDITVLLVGGRLQITADVDETGIAKLKGILEKYEDILKLLGGKTN